MSLLSLKLLSSVIWGKAPFLVIFVLLREVPTSDQSLKALKCVTAMLCSPKPTLRHLWLASYSSEVHLVLSTVGTLPQLSWGFYCLEAVMFSDLEFGCQSKMPDESGRRQEMFNSVRQSLPWGGMTYRTDLTWTKDWYLRHSHPYSASSLLNRSQSNNSNFVPQTSIRAKNI